MKRYTLRQCVFMAICCDLGLFSKRLISPITNILTDALHIPGGISTGFSLMFIILAALVCDVFGSATIMCAIQSGIALALGMVGSMGILAPLGYIIPGIIIDLIMLFCKRMLISKIIMTICANALGAVMAALTANIIAMHLRGATLWLYLMVAMISGAVCGILGHEIACRLLPAINVISAKGDADINENQ